MAERRTNRKDLVINNCVFRAVFPLPVEPIETEWYSPEEIALVLAEETKWYARECLEEITQTPTSAVIAGCDMTEDQEPRIAIALWAWPYVAAHYKVDGAALYAAWMRHYGPAFCQIALNPALAKAYQMVKQEKG